jgi:hypothetical protein
MEGVHFYDGRRGSARHGKRYPRPLGVLHMRPFSLANDYENVISRNWQFWKQCNVHRPAKTVDCNDSQRGDQ